MSQPQREVALVTAPHELELRAITGIALGCDQLYDLSRTWQQRHNPEGGHRAACLVEIDLKRT